MIPSRVGGTGSTAVSRIGFPTTLYQVLIAPWRDYDLTHIQDSLPPERQTLALRHAEYGPAMWTKIHASFAQIALYFMKPHFGDFFFAMRADRVKVLFIGIGNHVITPFAAEFHRTNGS